MWWLPADHGQGYGIGAEPYILLADPEIFAHLLIIACDCLTIQHFYDPCWGFCWYYEAVRAVAAGRERLRAGGW